MLTSHRQLPHLGQVRVGLLGIVAHQDVVRLPWLEVVTGSDGEGRIVDAERELSHLGESILEGYADAGAGLDSVGPLGSGQEAVAVEGNGIVASGWGGDGQGGLGVP